MKQSSVIILIIVGAVVLLGLALLTCIGLGAAWYLMADRGTEAPPPEFHYEPAAPPSEPGPPPSEPAPPPSEPDPPYSEPAPGIADRP